MFVKVKWSSSGYTELLGPDCLVYEYKGKIFVIDDEDEEIFIGKCRARYIDVERANMEGVDLYDVFDAHSGALEEYYGYIFNPNDSLSVEDEPSSIFSSDLNELFHENIVGDNLLILERVELLPEYRCKGLGLSVVRYMMARFSQGAGIIALKAFPLQFEKDQLTGKQLEWKHKLQLDLLPKNETKSKKKLVELYSKLGFCQLGKSQYMVFNVADGIPDAPITAFD